MLVEALSFSIVATFGIFGAQKYVLYRTKPNEPIKPEKINEIVNAFILTVKDKIVDKPLVYFDEKTLPFPKKDIENALFLAMHICKNANDDEQYNNLKVALVTMLPYYQKGVGKIPIPEFPEIEGMLENPNELIDIETTELVKKFDKINSNVNRKKIDALKKANLKDQMNFHDKLYLQKLEDRVWRFN